MQSMIPIRIWPTSNTAPAADEDTWDERLWHTWMPALGRTVRREDIRSAMADVEPAEAVRAFGNRTTVTMSALFPAEWLTRAWQVFAPPERLVLAVDVNETPGRQLPLCRGM